MSDQRGQVQNEQANQMFFFGGGRFNKWGALIGKLLSPQYHRAPDDPKENLLRFLTNTKGFHAPQELQELQELTMHPRSLWGKLSALPETAAKATRYNSLNILCLVSGRQAPSSAAGAGVEAQVGFSPAVI